MIEYINIYGKEWDLLSLKERKKSYCIQYSNGDKSWLVSNKMHREDGPAVILENGWVFFYLNDYEYPFEYWCKFLNKTDEEKLFLKLKYL